MMTTFIAAGIIPAFGPISEALGCSVTKASYLTSLQIAVVGWAPLFWRPIANRYGRRPVWLISTLGSMLFNIGCAKSTTYTSLAVCRAFTSFFISPAIAIGSGVVTETFFKKERGRYMGIWTLLVTLGPPAGPFFMGFVAYHIGFVWIFWINAIVRQAFSSNALQSFRTNMHQINGVQFIAYLFLGPETRYMRRGVDHRGSAFKQEYLNFGRIDPKPLRPVEFIEPLFLARYSSILIPTISYAMVFGFASVLITVEIPQLFLPKFGFNPQEIGLQFLGIIIGSVIGEQLSGPLSDWFVNAKTRKLGHRAQPEYRLWLSYGGFLLAMIGLIVFGVRTAQAPQMHWNVTPIVGIAIAAAGNQIVTTVLVTYAVDCHLEHSASIGVFVNVVRSTWGFIGPFWFPDMFNSIGVAASGGLMAGLIFIVSWVPIIFQQLFGQRWRNGPKTA